MRTKYVEGSLVQGEIILARGQLHWWIYVLPTLLILLGTLSLFGRSEGNFGGWIFVALGLFFLARAWIRAISTELAVTSRRVIVKTGLISRSTLELSHAKVESLSVDQGIVARLLNFGTVVLCGSGGTKSTVPGIVAPLEFRRKALEAIEGRPA